MSAPEAAPDLERAEPGSWAQAEWAAATRHLRAVPDLPDETPSGGPPMPPPPDPTTQLDYSATPTYRISLRGVELGGVAIAWGAPVGGVLGWAVSLTGINLWLLLALLFGGLLILGVITTIRGR